MEVFGLILSIALPPPEYDRPYAGRIEVIEQALPDVHGKCGGLGPRMFACALVGEGSCIIVLPKADDWITEAQRERLRRHEIGHCNGWPRDHAGGLL